MTIAVVFLLVLVGGLLPIAAVVRDWCIGHDIIEDNSWLVILFDLSRYLLSALFLLTVLAMFYHKGPSVKHRFRFLTPGSVFCLIAWILLGSVLRIYMNKMGERGYDRTYGALGGVAMLLLLFYVDALVMLIGAEINSEIDFEILKNPPRLAELSRSGKRQACRSQCAQRSGRGRSHNREDLKRHRAAWRIHLNRIANARFHQRIAHRAVDRYRKHVGIALSRLGFSNQSHELLAVIIQIKQLHGMAEEHHVLRHIRIGNHRHLAELSARAGQFHAGCCGFLPWQSGIRHSPRDRPARSFTDAFLHLDLQLVKLLALALHGGLSSALTICMS